MKWNAVKRCNLVLRMSMRNAPRDIGVSEDWGKKKGKKKIPDRAGLSYKERGILVI